jgi:F-type H+-transporting ATPase subunit delta
VVDNSQATDVGDRYARALFDLAVETHVLPAVEADLAQLKAMIRDSADFRTLMVSPRFDVEDRARGLMTLSERAGFCETTQKFLALLCANRRLAALSAVIPAFAKLAADRRGEVSAQVTTAVAMTPAQVEALAGALRQTLGKDPIIEARVDPALLGGLKVRVGSRLYDASLKSKLDSLKFALKRA